MVRCSRKKSRKKAAGLPPTNGKSQSSSASMLITQVLSKSQDRAGMSLAALKKALVVAGYNVQKNNSRIKLAVKGLVSKGVLVQISGSGASGSFKLSKKATTDASKDRGKGPSAQRKKRGLRASKHKRGAKKRAASRGAGENRKKNKRSKGFQPPKTSGKAQVKKPKASRPNLTLQKASSKKAVSRK
ncbi:histone H1t-like [Ctenodactylus gundi]